MQKPESNEYRFQVNLSGMITLLSDHLYSSPRVFVRELLQNGVDAIHAREMIQPDHVGHVNFELFPAAEGVQPTLMVEDNGIGLTREDIHQFLAMIGQTSKQGEGVVRSDDFIGRFGIGLLSCFVVSDEIVLITRALNGSETLEWRGKPDGTYTIRALEVDLNVGTRVYLRAKPECVEHFDAKSLDSSMRQYGEWLPYSIWFRHDQEVEAIHRAKPHWLFQPTMAEMKLNRVDVLRWAEEYFRDSFIDYIPLHSKSGAVSGVAFIMASPVPASIRQTHRVYLKKMLVSDRTEKILPDWAFFVKCVLNTNELQPTASREQFHEHALLDAARSELGDALKQYILNVAEKSPDQWEKIVSVHHLAMKALAVQDDEFFKVMIDQLPFYTTMGQKWMGEIRSVQDPILYAATDADYRQMSTVAQAQGLLLINAGYVYDRELLERLDWVYPSLTVEQIDPTDLSKRLKEVDPNAQDRAAAFIHQANEVLDEFQVRAKVKRFSPTEVPALYTTDRENGFLRQSQSGLEATNVLFAAIIEELTSPFKMERESQLCFNYENPLIQRLIDCSNETIREHAIKMLYVQSLLLGHHPLRSIERKLMMDGFMTWMDWGMKMADFEGK